MGTFQQPHPDRAWLRRDFVDTSTNPYSLDARTEMMGRLAEGTGGSRVARAVMRAVAGATLVAFAVELVRELLRIWT
ncbi:hypothetical protein [Micromonospora mirobrigensis]|uniref:Uncharacterized protein n=1 Tax=Micromonospora mirobrigensis TaxID=262898 RepID=A0A1C5AF99_9ACTN|nr:hypothetical protein [Micromonospora mirobrigensis]SCF43694.1 hypothetical protein GA0070564_109145 [Micromonospora mirobrigensis]